MVSRLILGSGTVGGRIVSQLRGQDGELTVLTDDAARVEALREEGIPAHQHDLHKGEGLDSHAPDVVFVGSDDGSVNLQAAKHARAAFPEARLIAYDPGGVDGLAAVADEVISVRGVVGDLVLALTEGPGGQSSRGLRAALRSIDDSLAVVTHDNPDPDAIASAVALVELAERVGLDATPCYYGSIDHQENRALVNLLELQLRNLTDDERVDDYGGVALVDHSRPGVNDRLPEDTAIDIVIDHHPPRGPVDAEFIHLDPAVGATATLMTGHLERFGIEIDGRTATALLYGLRVDTDDFSREVATRDFEAAARLLPAADLDILEQVEDPSVSPETFETLARAIRARRVDANVVVSYVGEIADSDSLAQAADLLEGMAGVEAALVYGILEETIHVSGRARRGKLDLGETLRAAFDAIGSAGGHAEMAGAQVELGSLTTLVTGDEDYHAVVETTIAERFLETVRSSPRGGISDADGAPTQISSSEYDAMSRLDGSVEDAEPGWEPESTDDT